MHVFNKMGLVLLLPIVLLHMVSAALYNVTPDGCNYTGTNSCLQHYLKDAGKHFTSHSQLLFRPGYYDINEDIVIQNLHNFSIFGQRNNNVINTIVTCSSSAGIAVINSSNIVIANIVMKNCASHFSATSTMPHPNVMTLFIVNCWNITVSHFQSIGSYAQYTSLVFMNIFGKSLLTNVKSSHLVISFEGVNFANGDTKHVVNVSHYTGVWNKLLTNSVSTFCSMASNINILLSQVTFVNQNALKIYCHNCGDHNITLHNCKFMDTYDNAYSATLIYGEFNGSSLMDFKYNEIIFIGCHFTNITLSELLRIEVDNNVEMNSSMRMQLAVSIVDSIFQHIKADNVIAVESFGQESPFLSYVLIQNSNFSYIITSRTLFKTFVMIMEGPVLLNNIISSYFIVQLNNESFNLTAHNYIEISNCRAKTAIAVSKIYIKEYTAINFISNTFKFVVIEQTNILETILLGTMLTYVIKPCIFQFTSKNGNLDNKFKQGEILNYSITFTENTVSHLAFSNDYLTSHCSWDHNAAFSIANPKEVNKKIISYVNNTITVNGSRRLMCVCNTSQEYDCDIDYLGPFYPGQTVSFKFFPMINLTLIDTVPIQIEDSLDPECQSENNSNVVQLNMNQCQEFKYVLQHKSGKRCELMFKFGHINDKTDYLYLTTAANVYTVTFKPCPYGFIFDNVTGMCRCDQILYLTKNLIVTCDINDQTVLRSANAWIFPDTSSDKKLNGYHVCLYCPYDYCLPYSSRLKLSHPDSQCQFNRTGVLCGQCQQGLSTVFGSSHCKLCSNKNLPIILSVTVVAGIALLSLLVFFKLTLATGYVNLFIFYANVININATLFFPVSASLPYTLISFTNLDLGIQACFYNGMTDYVKMWLQLAFPMYVIMIAFKFMVIGKRFTALQRITIERTTPVFATLLILSYTKVLRTVCNVLFFYSVTLHLPNMHTTIMWSVDTNVPLFGIEFTFLFVVCLILFMFLFLFTVAVVCTKPFSRFRFFDHFRPLMNVYKAPYKDKYHYWPGLQLIMRSVFIGLSVLDKNTYLVIGSLVIGALIIFHGILQPQKSQVNNVQDVLLLFNLQGMFIITISGTNAVIVHVLISVALFQFLCMFLYHGRRYFLNKISYINRTKISRIKNCFK